MSSSPRVDVDIAADLSSGGTIYVCTDALPVFAATVLPKIATPFTLVSGDSDLPVSLEGLGRETLKKLLENRYLQQWFAQNLAYAHPKLTHLPIGLDYHTVTAKTRHPWGGFETPLAQERALDGVRSKASALQEKKPFGYCNWHHSIGNGDRAAVLKALDQSAVYLEPARVERKRSWARNADFFFTISPFGQGMDCHRTWEALLLGSVPVVPASPLKPLFKDLPVVVVEDWRQITPGFLAEQKERILDATFDFSPLFLSYWQARFVQKRYRSLPRMEYAQFLLSTE
ncbi:hypothetical protein [Pseudovibrio exalbescens]|uniref:hypothetical protein n=1 Tax=Pseudovibrio exalbescens TaxID=197461 RepID=UPI0011AF0388|nr:hypothetical protein [Pseudovibrio exalbescens]